MDESSFAQDLSPDVQFYYQNKVESIRSTVYLHSCCIRMLHLAKYVKTDSYIPQGISSIFQWNR